MNNLIKVLFFSFFCLNANGSIAPFGKNDNDKLNVMRTVKYVIGYIKKYGMRKTLVHFKDSKNIFIGNYDGFFFVSPLHPELIGKNQFNYKDPSGAFVVREEINVAKSGGGWLKGRCRFNPLKKKYQCRKIYIMPVVENYYIGSWYYYSPIRHGVCLI